MTGIGTIVNGGAIASGWIIGGLFYSPHSQAWQRTLKEILAVFVLLIGLQLFISASQLGTLPVLVLVAGLLGGLVGELLKLEQRLSALVQGLELGLNRLGWPEPQLAEACITSSLLFVVAPLALIGSLRDALHQDPSLLYLKAAMDGVVAITLTATLGRGTILGCGAVLICQGSLTLLAAQIQPWVTPNLLGAMNGVGGLFWVSLGLNLLNLTRIPVCNLLPALAIAPLLVSFLPPSLR
jgi:uncharacterized protein